MSFVLKSGVQENQTVQPVPNLNTQPVGVIRLLTADPSEIVGDTDRANTITANGIQALPCIRTETAASPAAYAGVIQDYIDALDPGAGPVIELGNEPGVPLTGTTAEQNAQGFTNLSNFLKYFVAAYPVVRNSGRQVLIGATTDKCRYAGLRSNLALAKALDDHLQNSAWWQTDHFAVHIYKENGPDVLDNAQNVRGHVPIAKGLWITENGWPINFPAPWANGASFNAQVVADKITNTWTLLAAQAEPLNLRYYGYYMWSDLPAASDWDHFCGVVDVDGVAKPGTTTSPRIELIELPNAVTIVTDGGGGGGGGGGEIIEGGGGGGGASTVLAPPRLLEAVKKSHTLAVEAVVLKDQTPVANLPLVSGSVTMDAKAEVRGSFELTVNDPDLVPVDHRSLLAPYGNEIRIARGVRYPDGTSDLVNLGIFRIEEVEVSDTADGVEIRVSGQDRASRVSDAKFELPYTIQRGTLFADAILKLVEDGMGRDVEFNFFDKGITTPGLIAEEGDDRWGLAQGLAQALGGELFFDSEGVLILRAIPQPTTANYTREFVEGENGVLLEASKTWSRTEAFNRVILTAENSDQIPNIRAVVTDDEPESPTYYFGRFGKCPRFYSNEFITTQPQADDAAVGILALEMGITYEVNFGAIVDPTVRAGDVVLVQRDRLQMNEVHVLDSVTIPLDAESSMSATTRLVMGLQNLTAGPPHLLLSPTTLMFDTQVMF